MHQVLSWTVFYSKDPERYRLALNMLETSNGVFFQYFSLLTLFLNMCLCIDLMLTLKNPFEPAKKRMKYYLIGSALICFPLSFCTFASIDSLNQPSGQNHPYLVPEADSHMILSMCLSVYMIVAIYSCVYASRRLHRPSINRDVRHFFLKKHYIFVTIFIVVWGCYMGYAYFSLFILNGKPGNDPTVNQLQRKAVTYSSKLASVLTGILLTLTRLQEPFYTYQVKKRFYAFFGRIIRENKEYQRELYKNTLNHFLTKSLSIELVNVILQSIVQFTRESLKGDKEDEKRRASQLLMDNKS
jgi:hypothetical protein